MGDLVKKPSRVQVVETFAVCSLVFLLLAVCFQRQIFIFTAIALLTVALFIRPLAGVIASWWLKLSEVLSALNNRLILTILFYLVLTPIALLYRVFNKDPLKLDLTAAGSFYSERNHTYSKVDLEKMW